MSRSSPPASPRDDWWWIFDPRFSLRARAALGAGMLATGFTLLLAWLGGAMMQRHIEQQAGSALENLAFHLGDKIDRTLYARYRELQLLAALPAVRGGGAGDERRQALEALQTAAPDFAWIGFADRGGKVLSATQRAFEGTSAATREWFIAAHERPFFSSVHEIPALQAGDELGAPRFLDIAVAVPGPNGEIAGILGAHVAWSWTRDVLASVVPEAARREKLSGTLYAANHDALLDTGNTGWSEPPPPPGVGENPRARGALLEQVAGGAPFFTGYARSRGFREYRGLGWLAVVRQPAAIVFAPVAELRRRIVGWGAIFTGVLGAGAWWFSDRLVRRMQSVAVSAGRIRSGDELAVMPMPKGAAEIDDMCRAVGELVEEIRPKPAPADLVAPPLAKPAHSPVERMRNSV